MVRFIHLHKKCDKARLIQNMNKVMRKSGQKIANTFRSFADKETVDYSNKVKKFSKTEFAKKTFGVQKSCMRAWRSTWTQPLTR